MTIATVDDKKRVRIPSAKPGQAFSIEPKPDGSVLLLPVKAEQKERFPPGSLLKYFSGELGRKRDEEETEIGSACLQGPQ